MGKPSKLTPELLERICELIRDKGLYPLTAAVACGVKEATHYEWLQRSRGESPKGREGGGVYAEYADALKKAEADLELAVVEDTLAKVRHSKSPIGGFIFLSRRFRERWAETVQVSATKEAVAVMERLKAAWDAPDEVVEGEVRELRDGDRLAARGELPALGSHNSILTNQSEATGWHSPPPVELDDGLGSTAEATPQLQPNSPPVLPAETYIPPTNNITPDVQEGTEAEISETKTQEGE